MAEHRSILRPALAGGVVFAARPALAEPDRHDDRDDPQNDRELDDRAGDALVRDEPLGKKPQPFESSQSPPTV